MVSQWLEDKPFDEESLLAMSERGVGSKNTYSKGAGGTEEYILPPANYSEKIVGISPYNKEKYLKIKEPSAKAKTKAVQLLPAAIQFSSVIKEARHAHAAFWIHIQHPFLGVWTSPFSR